MSLTSYRAAPPRDKLVKAFGDEGSRANRSNILFVDPATTYSPAP